MWDGLTDLSIFGELVPNADTHQQLLTDINSPSEVADHRLWALAHSQFAYNVKTDLDQQRVEIEQKRLEAAYGNDFWWRARMLEFQYGYTLVRSGNSYVYATIDIEAQIIKRVSTRRAKGQILLLTALENTGTSAKLSTDQLNAAQAYSLTIAPSGIIPKVVSRDPDLLRINEMIIHYDPNILTGTGESILESGVFPVEDVIVAYPNELEFEGAFILDDLEARIKAVPGVVKIGNLDCSAKASDADVFIDIDVDYFTDAGYMIPDPDTTLSNQLTYVPAF